MTYGFGVLNDYAERAHRCSRAHGFWDDASMLGTPNAMTDTKLMLAKLMLVVTEAAEAAEEVRMGDHENFAEELADICIRTFDLAEACNVNLEQEIINKLHENEQRPHMHGEKRA